MQLLFNRLTVGLACLAIGLLMAVQAVSANAGLLASETAPRCLAAGLRLTNCYIWLTGPVTAVGSRPRSGTTGYSRSGTLITVDLPVGQTDVVVSTLGLPAGRPRVGDRIDVRMWRGEPTDIRLDGRTISTTTGPTFRQWAIAEVAVIVTGLGLLSLVAYVIDRRAGYVRGRTRRTARPRAGSRRPRPRA